MTSSLARNTEWAFNAYEASRHRLPSVDFPDQSQTVANLTDIADGIDLYLLDAFGVLNMGEQVIPGAPERMSELRAMGKKLLVVSNAAGYPKSKLMQRYTDLGFDFAPEDVLSSREVLLSAMPDMPPVHYGLMANEIFGREELETLSFDFLADDGAVYDGVDAFMFLGSSVWTEERQALLETSLLANPRPVLVGNPDIVAPRDTGLSKEPGHYAHRLADKTGIAPQFYGKPFGNVFNMALARVGQGIDPNRTVMVGDTLQTDILGGRAAGIKTALITNYGALRGMDPASAIERSGIVPDYIMPRP